VSTISLERMRASTVELSNSETCLLLKPEDLAKFYRIETILASRDQVYTFLSSVR
jgi:hypothetical protein